MRDDLEIILYEAAKDFAEFRFDVSATKIEQDELPVQVEFTDGKQEEFDVVIGADGLHSAIRSLSFSSDEIIKHYLGLQVAAYKHDGVAGMHNKFETHMERDRYMVIYSNRDGTQASVFVWKSNDQILPAPEQRWSVLQNEFKGAPELVQKSIDHFPNDDTMYMDPLIQIEMQQWHKGRVVLVGDAAHCMTLLSGQGASSAFSDACFLSKGLINGTAEEAFDYFEREMRPAISEMQPATRTVAGWYVPQNTLKQFTRDTAMRLLPNVFFQRYFKNKYSKI